MKNGGQRYNLKIQAHDATSAAVYYPQAGSGVDKKVSVSPRGWLTRFLWKLLSITVVIEWSTILRTYDAAEATPERRRRWQEEWSARFNTKLKVVD